MDVEKLKKISNRIRQLVIVSLTHAQSGHPAGSLGLADIFAYFYFYKLKVFPKDPWHEERDRFYLSIGHVCPVWYSALALRGFFDPNKLTMLRQIDSGLEGHPIFRSVPGIENTSGSLGQGLSQAIGAAIALKNNSNKIICIISDGELQEGQTWEALMFLGNSNLKNLTVIIDRNNIQQSNNTERVMPIEPLKEKLEAHKLIVFEVDGHNLVQFDEVYKKAELIDKPIVIVANTTPGYGVSFMENDYKWHGRKISKEEARLAIQELQKNV